MSDKCPGCGAEYVAYADAWECGCYPTWVTGIITRHVSEECYRRQLAQRDERISTLEQRERALVQWLHVECVVEGCCIDGGDAQEWLFEHGYLERRRPRPGSRDAEEWGEDLELYYLRPEYAEVRDE